MNQSINRDPLTDALAQAALGAAGDEGTKALYLRYLKTLALLCECAPYVEDTDYAEVIETVLNDASRHYPLRWRRDRVRWEIAPEG